MNSDIQLLVSIPQLIIGLIVIAAVTAMCWWSLREDNHRD